MVCHLRPDFAPPRQSLYGAQIVDSALQAKLGASRRLQLDRIRRLSGTLAPYKIAVCLGSSMLERHPMRLPAATNRNPPRNQRPAGATGRTCRFGPTQSCASLPSPQRINPHRRCKVRTIPISVSRTVPLPSAGNRDKDLSSRPNPAGGAVPFDNKTVRNSFG